MLALVAGLSAVLRDGCMVRARSDRGRTRRARRLRRPWPTAGIAVVSATVARPSLDDVYLRYAGRSFEARRWPDMSTLMSHSAYLSMRSIRALIRQPVFLVITLIQPMIWLLLFGKLFESVVQIPGFDGGGSRRTWSSSRPA